MWDLLRNRSIGDLHVWSLSHSINLSWHLLRLSTWFSVKISLKNFVRSKRFQKCFCSNSHDFHFLSTVTSFQKSEKLKVLIKRIKYFVSAIVEISAFPLSEFRLSPAEAHSTYKAWHEQFMLQFWDESAGLPGVYKATRVCVILAYSA